MHDEVDLLHVGKHESLLQIDSMEMVKNSQSSQTSKFAISLQYLKKELKAEVDFFMQSFQKVYFNTLSIKVAYKVHIIIVNGHDQVFSNHSNKCAISLQYLKKEIRNGDHFWHPDKRQSFYKLVLSFLMEVARHVQNTQNRKLVIFLQYIRKNVATALCSIVMQNIQIFYRGPVMFVVTCFSQIDVISIIEIQ